MFKLLRAEHLKLKGSLVFLLVGAVPMMMLFVVSMGIMTGNSTNEWKMSAMSASAIWAYFLFPMVVTALTALSAQIEHGSSSWNYVLTLKHSKWQVFLAKYLTNLFVLVAISILVGIAIIAGGILAGLIVPEEKLNGEIPSIFLTKTLSQMLAAGLMVFSMQYFLAMQFKSIAVPIIVGISGTFVAVVATSAKMGIYFPWLLPTNVLASDPERMQQAIISGLIGGVVIAIGSIIHLSRRDWV